MLSSLASLILAAIIFASVVRPEQNDFLSREHISSIAVLPPMGGDAPSSARTMSADVFTSKVKLRNSSVKIVAADETLSRLQAKSIMSDYSSFVTVFAQTGIINSDATKKLGQSLGTDAILLIDVLNYQEEKGSWWYGKGGQNIARIQYTLFRSSDGDKVWETLEFRQHDSKVSTNPYPMERVIGDITDKAVAALVSGEQHVDVRKKN
jgi:hypothetical protein